MVTVGSLCTGFGALDEAAAAVFGPARLAFVADVSPAAVALLAHRHPDVPNLGDIKAVDWADVEPVDILTAGFPCQDISNAGGRAGLEGEKSALWFTVAAAVRALRPRVVVLENVAALLGRGMGRVVGDLASLGYVGSWACVRASDVGAPHRRDRVFIVARPADTEGHPGRLAHGDGGQAPVRLGHGAVGGGLTLLPTPTNKDRGHRAAGAHGGAMLPEVIALLPTPTAQDQGRSPEAHLAMKARMADGHRTQITSLAVLARADFRQPLLPTPRASEGAKGGPNQRGSSGDLTLSSTVVQLLPTPTVADSRNSRNATAGRSDGAAAFDLGWTLSDVAYAERWGDYAAAVEQWEAILGRPAPEPTELGPKGNRRLSAPFVEWLMGCDQGWVCGVPGLSRTQQLHLLGNGVVKQQGAYGVALAGAA